MSMHKLTNDEKISQCIFADCLPKEEVPLPLDHTPGEHPVKVRHMVHDEQTAPLELPIVPKGPSLDTKQIFWKGN